MCLVRLITGLAAVTKVAAEGLHRASLALLFGNLILVSSLNWLTEVLYPPGFKQLLSFILSDQFPVFHSWCISEEPSSFLLVFLCCTVCLLAPFCKRGSPFPCSFLKPSHVPILPECAWLLWRSSRHEAHLDRLIICCSYLIGSPAKGYFFLSPVIFTASQSSIPIYWHDVETKRKGQKGKEKEKKGVRESKRKKEFLLEKAISLWQRKCIRNCQQHPLHLGQHWPG